MPASTSLIDSVQQRARRAEQRAGRARDRAAEALDHARKEVAAGNPRGEQLRLEEAELHERAASRQEQAAAIQRRHAEHLRRQ